MLLNNAPGEWSLVSTKEVYSNYFINLFEDTLDLQGRENLRKRN
jgi:hypothetical protein